MAKTPRKSKPAKAKPATKSKRTRGADKGLFPIVGLGASAGGLQVFRQFLEAMPPKSGLAFILIQHLDPDHESLMASLLETHTEMKVALAKNGDRVKPNHVYVIPPGVVLLIKDGILKLEAPQPKRGVRLPIDAFFKSLAESYQNQAIGVVLSGTGTDGTVGLKAIKEAGGLAIAQEPSEAPHSGMPRNAIANAAADKVMSVEDMPAALLRYAEHPYFNAAGETAVLGDRARGILQDVIALLKRRSAVDFGLYKNGTLLRRIERRMSIRHAEDGPAYMALLKDDEAEADLLAKDLLINVSGFFRDESVFQYLEKKIIPETVKAHATDQPFRVWVAGCATGEEAYSIAMLLIEQATKQKRHFKIQIFATDLDEDALAFARSGVFPDAIESDVSAERLARFFTKEDHLYQVKQELREAIVFADHNLLSDAPFSKLDLITCRNVLIYLDPKVQKRVIQLFHFALNEQGVLLLGTSETPGVGEDVFSPIHRKHRIYRRRGGRTRAHELEMPVHTAQSQRSIGAAHLAPPARAPSNPSEITRTALLDRHTPAAVLVNAKSEGLYFSGPVDRYLTVPVGEAGQDLIAMVRDGLRANLRTVLKAARDTGESAHSDGVWVKSDGERRQVGVAAEPVDVDDQQLLLVTFSDTIEGAVPSETQPVSKADKSAVAQLEKELASTRRELKLTIIDLEASNEELKAANEEAMSMNEEFQSTNEELETSKEELQSLNEELTTLNNQLQLKVDEHRQAVDDLNNLLNSSQIATVFLDKQLRIQRFTPTAKKLFSLIASDAGRPMGDITHKFDDDTMLADAEQVVETLIPANTQVKSNDGRWFQRRILPYRTQDDTVEGVVVTLHDITAQKTIQCRAEAEKAYAEAIVDTVREPLIVLNNNLKVVSAGRSFYEMFQTTAEETEGLSIYKLGDGQWDLPALLRGLKLILSEQIDLRDYEVDHEFPGIGRRIMVLNGRRIEGKGDRPDLILLAMEDLTEARRIEVALDEQNARLESILKSAQLGIITIGTDGIIKAFSSAAESMLGYTAEEVIGRNVNMFMASEDRTAHDGYLATYLKTGEKHIIGSGREVEGVCKDGRIIPLDLSVSEATYDHSRLFTGIIRELTEERRRQAELIQAQKMEAMGQLTGGVAHDFNNLLTVLLGDLELIESGKFPGKSEQLFEEAREAIKMGGELTQGLLAFGRRLPLSPEPADLNELVGQMRGILERTLPESIDISAPLNDDLWPVEVDPSGFKNAVLNLGLNARDAMPDGGKLILETANVVLDEDFAELHGEVAPGDYVAVSATDTGAGMSDAVQQRAFEPFFSTKETGKGSGLGLSVIYGFAKQSGGHVTIYSETGHGTTVTLFFPRQKDKGVASATVEKSPTKSSANGETILVVEDDQRVRRVTVRRLEALGYKVLRAPSGPEAMKVIDSGVEIDLVFTDMVMPGGMNGADVAREALKKRPDLKVLLTSGYAEEALDIADGAQMLRKPYSAKVLAQRLEEIFAR